MALLGPATEVRTMRVNHILLLGLHERVGDLPAAVGGRDEHDECAAGNDQAQGASGLVTRIVWIGMISGVALT
jgi:hypothetical protein